MTDGEDSSLGALVEAMRKDEVDLLLVLDCNAEYTAPGDVALRRSCCDFQSCGTDGGESLRRIWMRRPRCANGIFRCRMRWRRGGIAGGMMGWRALMQPLIEPLYASKSAVEFLTAVTAVGEGKGGGDAVGYEIVRGHWFGVWGNVESWRREMRWRRSLHEGVVAGSAFGDVEVSLRKDKRAAVADLVKAMGARGEGIELNFRSDPCVRGGEWANNPWLQELPKPLTRLTWDNAAIVSPATAARLGIGSKDGHESREHQSVVRISTGLGSRELPVWVQPGQPEDTVTVYLGGGRRRGGAVQAEVGVDVNPLRSSGELWRVADVRVERVSRTHQLACTQSHQVMDGRRNCAGARWIICRVRRIRRRVLIFILQGKIKMDRSFICRSMMNISTKDINGGW